MLNWLIPAAMGLIGMFGRGGSNNDNSGGSPESAMLQQLLPEYMSMFRMEGARQRAANPLYNAVLNQAFAGLPSWARNGVPGVPLLGVDLTNPGSGGGDDRAVPRNPPIPTPIPRA